MADHDALYQLSQALVNDLRTTGKVLVTAESCTGGWIAKAVTDVPGSSACFGYGIVSYSNGAKESILGVQSLTLDDNGSVSEPVVREMVDGALHLSGADIGVAVSGIAGPDGGTAEKPLGTVWFAWGSRDGARIHIDSACRQFDGDREAVRELTVAYALQGVLDRLQE